MLTKEAKKEKLPQLKEIEGVTPAIAQALLDQNINTIADFVNCPIPVLLQVNGIGGRKVHKMKESAEKILQQRFK